MPAQGVVDERGERMEQLMIRFVIVTFLSYKHVTLLIHDL